MPPEDEKTGGKEGFSVFTMLADSAKVIADIDITQGKGCCSLTVPALLQKQNKTKTERKTYVYTFQIKVALKH